MADVSRSPPRAGSRRRSTGRSKGGDDRGQLFLVAALSLAVLFVGFALLLNTAIYTENLATRNTDPGTDPSISYRDAAVEAATELMIRENANNTAETDFTEAEQKANYADSVADWSNGAGLHSARRARVTSMSVDSSVHGTRIEQTNRSRTFVDKQGTPSWNLGADASGNVRAAHLYVDRDSLLETNRSSVTSGVDSPFEVELKNTDTGNDRHMYVYDDTDTGGDDVTLLFEDEGGVTEECSYQHTGATAHIDLASREINGTSCAAFDRFDLPDSAVDDGDVRLRFEYGDQARGTYEVTVTGGVDVDESGDDHVYDNEGPDSDEGSPFASAVVYEATVTVTYRSTDVYYRTTVTVDPPEELR